MSTAALSGELQSTGIRPSFAERFALAGVRLPELLVSTGVGVVAMLFRPSSLPCW